MTSKREPSAWPFGCEGGPDDVLAPTGATSQAINKLLERAEVDAGEFCFGGAASMLPALPGLTVDGVGSIPVPLTMERVEKLIARCEKTAPDTEGDVAMQEENADNHWRLQPEHVELKNPAWAAGIEKASAMIADRLGFKRIALQCKLSKLLVYGEGAHFEKHQDLEKKAGEVAKLVIQLPSEHAGGALVIYRGRDMEFRYDFGTSDDTAPYLPYFAVHYVDAQHALEKVTSGFRLVLAYALCLPPEMRHLENAKGEKPLSEELAEVLSQLDDKDDYFTLLFSEKYLEQNITDLGIAALKTVDQVRFQALKEANSLIPSSKELHFYIAKLSHKVQFYDGRIGANKDPNWYEEDAYWQEHDRHDSVTWYSLGGEKYGGAVKTMNRNFIDSDEDIPEPTLKPNFLNPGKETLSQLWRTLHSKPYDGYSGDHMKKKTSSRLAVFAWPAAKGIDYALKFIGKDAAVAVLEAQESVDASMVQVFMEKASVQPSKKQESEPPRHRYSRRETSSMSVSLRFCQTLGGLLTKTGDPKLVHFFFENFFGGLEDKNAFAGGIVQLLQAFEWSAVGEAVLAACDCSPKMSEDFELQSSPRYPDEAGLELTLHVVDGLDRGHVQTILMRSAVGKAIEFPLKELAGSKSLDLLWKWAVRCEDKSILGDMVNYFKPMDPRMLRPVIDTFSKYVEGLDAKDKRLAALASVAQIRIDWLDMQIDELDRPFSWEMPDAQFPDNARVQTFLRGPESTMTTTGLVFFRNVKHARRWTGHKQRNASFTLQAGGTGGDAFVTITKTRDLFERLEKQVTKYKTERKLLIDRFGEALDSSEDPHTTGKKRRREEPEVIVNPDDP
ncbi:hypothetical protein BBJ28_00008396 [Nothophytophthora sp. Chile5]|nr:hypothetical protein BBJ28_00008396 [Nothophytophthora sp. Chile5]